MNTVRGTAESWSDGRELGEEDANSVRSLLTDDYLKQIGLPVAAAQQPGNDNLVNAKKDQAQPVDKVAAKPSTVELANVPNSYLVCQILSRCLEPVNELLRRENAEKESNNQPAEKLFDDSKLREEWSRGEFGPESRRLWLKAHMVIEQDVTAFAFELESRGMAFPPGAPLRPEKSLSGSGLPETDEMFRSRLRNGDVKFAFPAKPLSDAGIPSADDVSALTNNYIWTQLAKQKCVVAAVDSQASSIELHLKHIQSMSQGSLDGWKRPANATTEQLQQWSYASMDWMNTVQRVRSYSDAIASFNAATTDKGIHFPGLTDLFKRIKLPDNATVFPDDALKAGNFPGTVKRGEDGSILELKLDLPTSPERTPENLRKMEKLESWLRTWGPQVDKLWALVLDADKDPNRTLLWSVDGDFARTKSIGLEKLQPLNADLHGDARDIGRQVKVQGDEQDWFVKAVKANGNYELEKLAPNGQPFNLKKSGFTTEACDKEGRPDPKGDYLKVTSYRDYLWARCYAYNNWDYFGSIQPVHRINAEPQVFHKTDFVPIIEDGKMRVLQARHLQPWADAQDNARRTGNVVGTAVDVGMLVSGTYEFRAGWIAAKKMSDVAAKQVAKEYFKGAWHVGLGATGFGKQAIENNFSWGHDFMQVRHVLLMADMGIQVAPHAAQQRLWANVPYFGSAKGKTAMEGYAEWALTKDAKTIDAILGKANKLYSGYELRRDSRYLPHFGIFFLADSYYLAEATNTASLLFKEDHREALVDAMIAHRRKTEGHSPLLFKLESAERLKSATKSVLDDYARKIGGEAGALLSSAPEILFTAPGTAEREKVKARAASMYILGPTEKERVAAGVLLLALSDDAKAHDVLVDKPGYVSHNASDILRFLRKSAQQSENMDVRLVAGDTLFRLARTNAAKIESLEALSKELEAQLNTNANDAALKQRRDEAQQALKHATDMRQSTRFNAADFGGLLLEVLQSEKATRAQKIDAISSPNSVRLAMLMEDFRYSRDGKSNLQAQAALYGRDADTIERILKTIADGNGDGDLRSVAAAALAAVSGQRLTVNGVPITPEQKLVVGAGNDAGIKAAGNGVLPAHLVVKTAQDGRLVAEKANPAAQVWIVKSGKTAAQAEPLNELSIVLGPGDRVILGDKQNGHELLLGHERADALLRLNGMVKAQANVPGALLKEFQSKLRRDFELAVDESLPATRRDELLLTKFHATKAMKSTKPELAGFDAVKLPAQIAENLTECIMTGSAPVAKAALLEMSPELLAALPAEKLDKLREFAFGPLRTPRGNEAFDSFRLELIARSPQLFAEATPQQKTLLSCYLEAILIPGADADFSIRNKEVLFPRFEPSFPESRAIALRALALVDGERATRLAELMLVGGTYSGRTITKDSAIVRSSAVDVLDSLKPFDLQRVALSALRNENDPAVLQKLWNLEYSARVVLDPVRLEKEMAGLRERVELRAGAGWMPPGPRRRPYSSSHDVEDAITRCVEGGCPDNCLEFRKKSMTSLLQGATLQTVEEKEINFAAAESLSRVADKIPAEMVKSLSGPLENVLLSFPELHPDMRQRLLQVYLKLKPGENGVVSRDETALVLSRMLEQSVRDSKHAKDPALSAAHERLMLSILNALKDYKAAVSVPVLTVSIGNDGIKYPGLKTVAAQLLSELTETTALAKAGADFELQFAKRDPKNRPLTVLGHATSAGGLAESMASALADSSKDAFQVVKTLIACTETSPFEGANDPRLSLLRVALKDKNDLVRVAAAGLCLKSPAGEDKERAAFALADLSKNSSLAGTRTESLKLLSSLSATNPELVRRALAETPVNTRTTPNDSRALVTPDITMQRHFENVRRSLLGTPLGAGWTSKQFEDFGTRMQLPLLVHSSRWNAIDDEMRRLGNEYDPVFRNNTKYKAALDSAAEAVLQKMWVQLQQVSQTAMDANADPAKRREAIDALVYIVASQGDSFITAGGLPIRINLDRRSEAVDRAVDALTAICVGKSFSSGELDLAISRMLTEDARLHAVNKTKLLSAFEALVGNKNMLSRENATQILTLAFETEMRFMPRPGAKSDLTHTVRHLASIQYQLRLLELMGKYGNAELVPVLDYFAGRHSEQIIRDKANQIKSTMAKSVDDVVRTSVNATVADINGTKPFVPITNPSDPRIPLLKAAASNLDLPIEHRFRAAEVLLASGNRGLSEQERKEAASRYAHWGIRASLPDERKRFNAICVVMDKNNPLFIDLDRNAAVRALAALSVGGGPQIRERAMYELTKLKGDQLELGASQLLSQANIFATIKDKGAQVDFALTIVGRLHEQAIKQNRSIIGKEQSQLLAKVALQGNDKAMAMIAALPADMRKEALKATSESFEIQMKRVEAENVLRKQLSEDTKQLAKRYNWSDVMLKDLLAKQQPIELDGVLIARFIKQMATLESGLPADKETDALLFKAYSQSRAFSGADLTALRVRVDKGIERLKTDPVKEKNDPRSAWLQWYERETFKAPTETDLLTKYQKELESTSDKNKRAKAWGEVLLIAVGTKETPTRESAFALLKTIKEDERLQLKSLVDMLAKSMDDPKQRYSPADRALVKDLQTLLAP